MNSETFGGKTDCRKCGRTIRTGFPVNGSASWCPVSKSPVPQKLCPPMRTVTCASFEPDERKSKNAVTSRISA